MVDEPITSLEQQLRDAVSNSGMSLNEIERRCGVSHAVLSRFLRGERTVSLPIAGKLCQLLGLDLTPLSSKTDATAREPSAVRKTQKRKGG